MTPEKEEDILRTVRLGLRPERAATAHGISPGTMRSHRKRHPSFATAMKEAEATAEASFLSAIIRHTDRQWTAAAWILERRFGWTKREEVQVSSRGEARRLLDDLETIRRMDRGANTERNGNGAH